MSYITDVLQNNKFLNTFSYWCKLDGQICFLSGTSQCKLHSEHYYINLVNVVHSNNKAVQQKQSSRIIKIFANIKLNKVVYIKFKNKSIYQNFFT